MIENKDKVYLEKKWWYRLLKVSFIFCLILTTLLGVALVYSLTDQKQLSQQTLETIGRNVRRDAVYQDADLTGYSDFEIGKRVEDRGALSKALERYNLKPEYTSIYPLDKKVIYYFGVILTIAIAFFILSRIFFYIVLGEAFPRKVLTSRAASLDKD